MAFLCWAKGFLIVVVVVWWVGQKTGELQIRRELTPAPGCGGGVGE